VERARALMRELDDESDDRRLLARLDEIQVTQAADDLWMSGFAEKQALQEYSQAFAAHGLGVSARAGDETARRLGQRPGKMREAWVAALEDWLDLARWHQDLEADRLARVVDAADRDPWRQELRLALARDDWATLDRLAGGEEFGRQRPQ